MVLRWYEPLVVPGLLRRRHVILAPAHHPPPRSCRPVHAETDAGPSAETSQPGNTYPRLDLTTRVVREALRLTDFANSTRVFLEG